MFASLGAGAGGAIRGASNYLQRVYAGAGVR